MDKNQKIVLFSGIGVVVILIGVLVWLLLDSGSDDESAQTATEVPVSKADADDYLQMQNDSLRLVADMAALDVMDRDLSDLGTDLSPEQQELKKKYDEARNNIEKLMAELKEERQKAARNGKRSQAEIDSYRQKVSDLEGQIAQRKDYCKDLLGRLGEMTEKYNEQVAINTELSEKNRSLEQTVTDTKSKNEQLTTTVNNARRLTLTGVNLHAYNKKGKSEKKVKKATQLGVSFTITPNNTASAGMKTFYVIIKTPEGQQLGGAGSFTADGATLHATAAKNIEYSNDEKSDIIYWNVNTTLTPGSYTVSIFCDGTRLTTKHFTLN